MADSERKLNSVSLQKIAFEIDSARRNDLHRPDCGVPDEEAIKRELGLTRDQLYFSQSRVEETGESPKKKKKIDRRAYDYSDNPDGF